VENFVITFPASFAHLIKRESFTGIYISYTDRLTPGSVSDSECESESYGIVVNSS